MCDGLILGLAETSTSVAVAKRNSPPLVTVQLTTRGPHLVLLAQFKARWNDSLNDDSVSWLVFPSTQKVAKQQQPVRREFFLFLVC